MEGLDNTCNCKCDYLRYLFHADFKARKIVTFPTLSFQINGCCIENINNHGWHIVQAYTYNGRKEILLVSACLSISLCIRECSPRHGQEILDKVHLVLV